MFQGFHIKDKLYRDVEGRFSTRIPWSFIGGPGVVVQKTGVMQKSFQFRGPDVESASAASVAMISYRLNDAVKRLGDGWAVYFEVQRTLSSDYPVATFNNPAGYLIDCERAANFQNYGKHFESSYYLTFVYLPESDTAGKTKGFFVKQKIQDKKADLRKVQGEIDFFLSKTMEVVSLISSDIQIHAMENDETLTYLHSTVSRRHHYVREPERLVFLDSLLADSPLDIASTLKLDEDYIPIVSINSFPTETFPSILDSLNRMNLEYRWVSRFVCLDKTDAEREIVKYQKKFIGARKSFSQFATETANKESSDRVNQGALAMEDEANEAQRLVATDLVGFGYFTTSVMVWDKDLDVALEKAHEVRDVITATGFTAFEETHNAYNAFLGMMPGHVYANQRRHFVTTQNAAHVVPLSAVWVGQTNNDYLESIIGSAIPHVVCSTGYGTPFFLNLNVGDIGHCFITGVTGSGKSVIGGLFGGQWLKYPGARYFCFDVDRSARQLTMAVGGDYYEPGNERGGMSFQPLLDIDGIDGQVWAAEFIELLLSLQNVEMTGPIRNAVSDAIRVMRDLDKVRRTLTEFCSYCSYVDPDTDDNTITTALQIYTIDGIYGNIFDSNCGDVEFGDWTMIEMRPLMELGPQAATPAIMIILHLLERLFDPARPLLVWLDECWLLLDHPVLRKSIRSYLKTLRKYSVFMVFATQEVHDVMNSEISTTLIEQCLTKIYLPNPSAMQSLEAYERMGLTEAETFQVSRATMKQDYFYKSPLGVRMFQLDLGPLTLALIGRPDHETLDKIAKRVPKDLWVYAILQSKGVDYMKYLEQLPGLADVVVPDFTQELEEELGEEASA